MKQFILKNKTTVAGMAVCLLLGILTLSFQDTPYVKAILDNQEPQDTTPVKKKKRSMTMKEFDKLSADLDGQVFDGVGMVAAVSRYAFPASTGPGSSFCVRPRCMPAIRALFLLDD